MADHRPWVFPALRAVITKRQAHGEGEDRNGVGLFETVSMKQDGISWHVEQQLRWTTCTFIEDLAKLVEIPSAPCVLAQLYVQRFYMLHPFSTHDRFLVATAALFLAGKSEEFPIKVRLMTECAMYLLLCKPDHNVDDRASSTPRTTPSNAAQSASQAANGRRRKSANGKTVEMSSSLGNDPEAANAKHLDCLHALLNVLDVGQIETTAARVLLLERVLLQTLSFDLSIPQPFAYVPRFMDKLFALEAMDPSVPYDAIRYLSYLILSDAVKSGVVLAFNSMELAAAAVYVSSLHRNNVSKNVTTDKNDPWWSVFGLPAEQLEDAVRGILWIYEDEEGNVRKGLSEGMINLWARYRPDQNLPDLEFVKQLDASVLRSPQRHF